VADPDGSSRYDRERSFHDHRYQQSTRGGTSRFYPDDSPSKLAYQHALAAAPSGARVLEYGCGRGSAAFGLAARGCEVTGIDISEVAVEQAAEEADREGLEIEFRVMNAEHLQVPDASFDLVCGSGILHHLDLGNAWDQLARVLRPSGRAVFLEPLGHNPLINLYRRLTPSLRTVDEHPLTMADVSAAGERFGAVTTSFHQLLWLATVPVRGLPGGRRASRLADRADQWLFGHVPVLRGLAWTSVLVLADPQQTSPPEVARGSDAAVTPPR
jgi:ubiquinone/menaquinone biosynthesis C-methylase UbiE